MDFLFIHGNYPAQFKHLAALLGQNPNNRVIFLTAREDAHEDALPGVEIHRYSCHRAPCLETLITFKPRRKPCYKVKQY